MLSVSDFVRQSHIFSDIGTDVRPVIDPQVIDEEPVCQVVDPVEAGTLIVWFCEDKVYVDEIFADPVDCTESYLCQERHSDFYGMHVKMADLAVFGNKVLEQSDCFHAFSRQEVINSIMAA